MVTLVIVNISAPSAGDCIQALRHVTGKRGGKGNWGEVSEGKKDLGKTPVGAGIPRGRIPRTYIA